MNLKQVWHQLVKFLLRTHAKATRRAKNARDLERINAAADRLNAEAAEVLEYQSARGLEDVLRRIDALPTLDTRPANEILGYDSEGLPR